METGTSQTFIASLATRAVSLPATQWAWRQQGLRPLHKLILLRLADRAGDDNTVWPSYSLICEDTGVDKKTVWAAIKALRDIGLISDTGRRTGRTGQIPILELVGVTSRNDESCGCSSDKEHQKRNDSKNGTIPLLPANDSENGMVNDSENGIRNLPNESTKNLSSSSGSPDRPEPVVGKPSKPNCPHQEIIDLYHEALPVSPIIRDWTQARSALLRNRWNEDPARQNLEYWKRLFAFCAKSDFLTGKVATPGRKPFTVSLDWLLKPENFAKVREGRYHQEAAQ